MLEQILLFFAKEGIYLVLILSLLNFKREAKTIIALGLSMAIAYAISTIFYVPPPFVQGHYQPLIPHAPTSSFPSHHSAVAFTMSFSTFNTNTILGLASSVISVLIVIGRLYAGLHYKIDVIGGLFIGGFCAIFAYSSFVDNLIKKIYSIFLKDKIKDDRQKQSTHKMVSSDVKKRGKKAKRSRDQ